MSADENEQDLDDVPLHRKKPFGSGLRRNEIKFVPASDQDPPSTDQPGGRSNGQSISDLYLSMVLKKPEPDAPHVEPARAAVLCDVCKMPLSCTDDTDDTAGSSSSSSSSSSRSSTSTRKGGDHHEASIAHQVCLAHSHPPSALDRSRMGLSVLESQGWDPDSRAGLGAAGQGPQYPIKVKSKDNRLGIGVVLPKDPGAQKPTPTPTPKPKPKLLDAKKVRKTIAEDRKRTDRLQQQIFGRVDLERYLGPGA